MTTPPRPSEDDTCYLLTTKNMYAGLKRLGVAIEEIKKYECGWIFLGPGTTKIRVAAKT